MWVGSVGLTTPTWPERVCKDTLTLRFHQIRVCQVAAPPRQQSWWFHSSLFVYFHQVRCAVYLLLPTPAVQSPLEQICWTYAEILLNLAPSRQEVTHRNNNITTSKQISKERQTQALLRIFWLGSFRIVVFITQTYNCCRQWLCDYCGNSSVSRWQLSEPWRTQNTILGDCQTRAVTQYTRI